MPRTVPAPPVTCRFHCTAGSPVFMYDTGGPLKHFDLSFRGCSDQPVEHRITGPARGMSWKCRGTPTGRGGERNRAGIHSFYGAIPGPAPLPACLGPAPASPVGWLTGLIFESARQGKSAAGVKTGLDGTSLAYHRELLNASRRRSHCTLWNLSTPSWSWRSSMRSDCRSRIIRTF